MAGKASGGAEFAFTLATIQLVVGSIYALFLWLAPEARAAPKMTFRQVMALAPLGFWAAVAHGGAVYAMTAGAVSFGQIVKAGEPVFAAIIGYLVYNSKVSAAKIACLVPVIGGIAIASAKELDFTMGSLLAASTANVASAFRGGENKRAMQGELKVAIGGVGNAYAITTLWAVREQRGYSMCMRMHMPGHRSCRPLSRRRRRCESTVLTESRLLANRARPLSGLSVMCPPLSVAVRS